MTNKASKSLRYYFLILCSGILLLGILMWIYSNNHGYCPSYFVYLTMLLPAAACMAMKLLTTYQHTPARKFYLFYLTVVILLFLIVVLSFILTIDFEILCTALITFASITGYFFLANIPRQDLISSDLSISGNKKLSLIHI